MLTPRVSAVVFFDGGQELTSRPARSTPRPGSIEAAISSESGAGMRAGLSWTDVPEDSFEELPAAGPPYMPIDGTPATADAPASATTTSARRDRDSLDLVVCERCERTVLRGAFDDHALICVTLPTADESLAATTAAASAVPTGGKRKSPPSGGGGAGRGKGSGVGKASGLVLGSSALAPGGSPAGARASPGSMSDGRGLAAMAVGGMAGGPQGAKAASKKKRAGSHHKGIGMPGADKASKSARGRAGGAALAEVIAQNAEELRAREDEAVTAQWRTTLALLRAPPRRPPMPLVDRDALHRQLRPRARVVPLPADAPTNAAAGRPPAGAGGSSAAARAPSTAPQQAQAVPARLGTAAPPRRATPVGAAVCGTAVNPSTAQHRA